MEEGHAAELPTLFLDRILGGIAVPGLLRELMKDQRIRYRSAERNAVIAHRVQAFCLTRGNLRAADG